MTEQDENISKDEEILKEARKYMNKDVSFFDAVMEYAKDNDIEIELVGEIIKCSPNLKEMVRQDVEKLNLVEKKQRLPI